MKSLMFLLLFAFVSAPVCLAAEPDSSEHPAVKSARTYIDKLKANQAADAVSGFWDLDAFLNSAFGLQYLDLKDEEKKSTQRALAKFLAAPFANPQMSQLFATISVQSAKLTTYTDTLAGVTLDLSGGDGKFRGVNTLLFSKSGEEWRIVDQRQGAAMPIRTAIVMMWLEERRSPNATIAGILEKATEQVLQKTAEKEKR